MGLQKLQKTERRWHWRTWIQQATDGQDARQRSGEMTVRALGVACGPGLRALSDRRWIDSDDAGEVEMENGTLRFLPFWKITRAGREALAAAAQERIWFSPGCLAADGPAQRTLFGA